MKQQLFLPMLDLVIGLSLLQTKGLPDAMRSEGLWKDTTSSKYFSLIRSQGPLASAFSFPYRSLMPVTSRQWPRISCRAKPMFLAGASTALEPALTSGPSLSSTMSKRQRWYMSTLHTYTTIYIYMHVLLTYVNGLCLRWNLFLTFFPTHHYFEAPCTLLCIPLASSF